MLLLLFIFIRYSTRPFDQNWWLIKVVVLDWNVSSLCFLQSNTSFNRDVVKAGTGRRFLGGLLDDTSYCYTLEVSFYSYMTAGSNAPVPYTEETCILQPTGTVLWLLCTLTYMSSLNLMVGIVTASPGGSSQKLAEACLSWPTSDGAVGVKVMVTWCLLSLSDKTIWGAALF